MPAGGQPVYFSAAGEHLWRCAAQLLSGSRLHGASTELSITCSEAGTQPASSRSPPYHQALHASVCRTPATGDALQFQPKQQRTISTTLHELHPSKFALGMLLLTVAAADMLANMLYKPPCLPSLRTTSRITKQEGAALQSEGALQHTSLAVSAHCCAGSLEGEQCSPV